jgi:hypothetical protein
MGASGPPGELPPTVHPTRLTGSDALRLHLVLAAGLAICIGAFIIELLRALGGHSFSWIYVFEWPLFAGFAIYMWWNLLHGNDRAHRASSDTSAASTGDMRDEGLDQWNLYLQVMEAAEQHDTNWPS